MIVFDLEGRRSRVITKCPQVYISSPRHLSGTTQVIRGLLTISFLENVRPVRINFRRTELD